VKVVRRTWKIKIILWILDQLEQYIERKALLETRRIIRPTSAETEKIVILQAEHQVNDNILTFYTLWDYIASRYPEVKHGHWVLEWEGPISLVITEKEKRIK
jgi:hypothetical protein